MLQGFGKFVAERAKSLVSKKVAATAVGVTALGATDPQLAGWCLIAYIAVQGAQDGWKHYVDTRYGSGD